MSRFRSLSSRLSFSALFVAGLVSLLLASPVAGASETTFEDLECGEAEREAFATAAANGASLEDLYAQFSYCTVPPAPVQVPIPGGKVVTNFNINWERMNSCGYHPQADLVSCDVEIRLPSFYGPFPVGTNEYIKFCYDCNQDGIFDYSSLGAVHTTDDISGTSPPWFLEAHSTTWPDLGLNNTNNPPHVNAFPPFVPALPWSCIQNDGLAHNIRAILSWAVPPGGTCQNPQVVFGNMIDFQTRRDP